MASLRQPLVAAALSVKFCVAVAAFGTAMLEAEAGSKPALLALTDGYVPAGSVNVYCPLALVVVVREPTWIVAPLTGLAPLVTVQESVPLPTVVQPGNWNEPIRVWWSRPFAW